MKKCVFVIVLVLSGILMSSTSFAQNPLKKIPIQITGYTNTTASIIDFQFSKNMLTALVSITGTSSTGEGYNEKISIPITIVDANCNALNLRVGTAGISNQNSTTEIGGWNLSIHPNHGEVNKVKRILCSIEKLSLGKAPLNAIAGKMRQLIRSLS